MWVGYDLESESFLLAHNMIEVFGGSFGFPSRSYSGRVSLYTEELIKGKAARKLILRFTEDMANSQEVAAYRKILGAFG